MPNSAALISAFLNSGLVQYPDKKLYQAAMELRDRPDDRPTVPVRLVSPKNYMQAAAYWDQPNQEIKVNRKAGEYKNPRLLAAILAHEADHVRRTGQPDEKIEGPAYQRQLDVLKYLKFGDRDIVNRLEQLRQAAVLADKDKMGTK